VDDELSGSAALARGEALDALLQLVIGKPA
jgi:hypothetical protein